MTLAPDLSTATRAQHIGRARRKAQRIVLLIANAPIIHGALPTAIDAQDWGPALDAGQCALWLLERDYRWLAAEEIALEWLRQMQLTDHGVWPELIPYPAEALARVKEAA